MPSGVAFERAVLGAFAHGLCNGQKFAPKTRVTGANLSPSATVAPSSCQFLSDVQPEFHR